VPGRIVGGREMDMIILEPGDEPGWWSRREEGRQEEPAPSNIEYGVPWDNFKDTTLLDSF
jgi:hypothetical protein